MLNFVIAMSGLQQVDLGLGVGYLTRASPLFCFPSLFGWEWRDQTGAFISLNSTILALLP